MLLCISNYIIHTLYIYIYIYICRCEAMCGYVWLCVALGLFVFGFGKPRTVLGLPTVCENDLEKCQVPKCT